MTSEGRLLKAKQLLLRSRERCAWSPGGPCRKPTALRPPCWAVRAHSQQGPLPLRVKGPSDESVAESLPAVESPSFGLGHKPVLCVLLTHVIGEPDSRAAPHPIWGSLSHLSSYCNALTS